jgi:hypothetical protein
MTEQTEMEPVAEAPAEKRTQGPQTYVVQIQTEVTTSTLGGDDTSEKACWIDIATVTVPPRTKRSKVVAQGLMLAGIKPDPGQPAPRVRVLDEESASVHEPGAVQPPAEWVV